MKDPKRLLATTLLCAAALALWPSDAAAQRRGRPVRGGSTVVVVRPSFYGGYYGYGGFYDPFFWGYGRWYPYGLYPPYYRGDFFYDRNVGSARIQVTPKQAEVYVDGRLVGNVDNFDGFLQRLDVPAGEHELAFYLDGYRTIRQKVLFRPGATVKINNAMEPLAQGAPNEPRPQPDPDAPAEGRQTVVPTPEGRRAQPVREREDRSGVGSLAIRVQPRDASVFVDGEEWTGPDGPGPLLLELGAGSHEVEVRKQGFATYRKTVQVRGGETVALNVSLPR